MNVHYTPHLPPKHFDLVAGKMKAKDKLALQIATTSYMEIWDGHRLLAVVGLMYGDALSSSVTLWFGIARNYRPTFTDLRRARERFPEWLEPLAPDFVRAEIATFDHKSRKFAEFFGFKIYSHESDRLVLEMER